MYLKGWFWFDVVTSIPISYMELAILAECESTGGQPPGAAADAASGVGNRVLTEDPTTLRLMRWVKPLRYFKILRILKIAKGGEYINQVLVAPSPPAAFQHVSWMHSLLSVCEVLQVMEYWNVSPMLAKMVRTVGWLFLSIHMIACTWWLSKVLVMAAYTEDGLGGQGTLLYANAFLDGQSYGPAQSYGMLPPLRSSEPVGPGDCCAVTWVVWSSGVQTATCSPAMLACHDRLCVRLRTSRHHAFVAQPAHACVAQPAVISP